LFSSLLRFWEGWPDAPPNRLVICGSSLTYQRSKESTKRFGFWPEKPNQRLRQLVAQLEAYKSDKLSLSILPELHKITRKEAEDWLDHPKVRSSCRVPKAAITELYRSNQDRPIEMEELAKKLQQLLRGDEARAALSFERS
jgi:hypothetical protein